MESTHKLGARRRRVTKTRKTKLEVDKALGVRLIPDYELVNRFRVIGQAVLGLFNEEFEKFWEQVKPLAERIQTENYTEQTFKRDVIEFLSGEVRMWIIPLLEQDARFRYRSIAYGCKTNRVRFSHDKIVAEIISGFFQPSYAFSVVKVVERVLAMPRSFLALALGEHALGVHWLERFNRDFAKLRGKKVSSARMRLYQEFDQILQAQRERGEDQNFSQASRIMKKRHNWTDKQQDNFLRAFLKIRPKLPF